MVTEKCKRRDFEGPKVGWGVSQKGERNFHANDTPYVLPKQTVRILQ